MYKVADVLHHPSYIEMGTPSKAEDEEIPVKDIVAYVYDEFKDKDPRLILKEGRNPVCRWFCPSTEMQT